MAANTVRIDDADARIRYSGRWEIANNPDEYNATTHGTNSAGAQAEFLFNGTSIAVYGTIGAKSDSVFSAASTYTLDGSSPTPNTGVPGSKILYNQLLYRSPNLADGQHTLVITSTLGGGSMFWLDYLQIALFDTGAILNSTSNSITSPQNPSLTSTNPISSSDDPSSAPSRVPAPAQGSFGGGAIAGIVIGSFACILLAFILVWLWRRKTWPNDYNENFVQVWEKPKRVSIEITPFNLASTPTTPAVRQSHFHRSDVQSTVPTTTSPSREQGSGYSIGTTLIEKRGPGANNNTATNSQPPARLSPSQTLVTASSPTAFSPNDALGSGLSTGNHARQQNSDAIAIKGGFDGLPSYA